MPQVRPDWVIVSTFIRGQVAVEVSRAGDTDRYSFRVSHTPDGKRFNAWMPANRSPYLRDLGEAFGEAEGWVAAQKSARKG